MDPVRNLLSWNAESRGLSDKVAVYFTAVNLGGNVLF